MLQNTCLLIFLQQVLYNFFNRDILSSSYMQRLFLKDFSFLSFVVLNGMEKMRLVLMLSSEDGEHTQALGPLPGCSCVCGAGLRVKERDVMAP